MKKLVLLMVVAVLVFAANAATKTVDGVTYTYEGGVIYKIEGDAKVINIPQKLDSMEEVCWLQKGCLQNNMTVMKVVIPEKVIEISESAFRDCVALTTLNIPAGVTKINADTFNGCRNLRSIALPKGLTSIGDRAFRGCASLTSIELPDGLLSIGTDAIDNCSMLTELIIPDSVQSLGASAFDYCGNLRVVRLPSGITSIKNNMFFDCYKLETVNIPSSVSVIESEVFFNTSKIKEIVLPSGIVSIGRTSFVGVGRVIFQGKPPAGLASASVSAAVFPEEYGALWRAQLEIAKIGGYVNPNKPVVTVVSSKVRENNPTVLDVVYKVTSTKSTVRVRALAFEDGERSLNKVTRPETFIEGTAANLGDAIAPNVEHKLSWQVSSDFKTDLAKMKFEVLAVEDGILPLEFITIPANGTNKKMQLSWNLLKEQQYFDALFWLYADKTEGLSLVDGVLKVGDAIIADSNSIKPTTKGSTAICRKRVAA